MAITNLIARADADADLTGTVEFTAEEWTALRAALAASSQVRLIAHVRDLNAKLKTFAVLLPKDIRESISAAEATLKELG